MTRKIALIFVMALCLFACKQKLPSALDRHVVLENDKVKVSEYTSIPGGDVCGEGRHTHPAHLNVLLTDAKVKIMLPDGKILTQNAPAGTTFWSDAETHTVTNTGNHTIKGYIIETKH
jgi:hypothetical protein